MLFKSTNMCYNNYIRMLKRERGMRPFCFAREECAVYEPKLNNEQIDMLMEAMMHLRSKEDAHRFFEDLCTIAELKSMAQRLEVATLLRRGVTYQEIARVTGASSATISRVNRALIYGADGYVRVLDALDAVQADETAE